jgi:hypothetical protein
MADDLAEELRRSAETWSNGAVGAAMYHTVIGSVE